LSYPRALVVIAGPTASGKSGLALALAERLGTVILSADSRQVYQGFDIGTAKPTLAERSRIPHYLIDLCPPTTTLTLGDYQLQAQPLIQQIQAAGRVPLLVGGTGLYIKAIARGMQMPRVPPQPELRSQLVAQGQPLCHQLLHQVDPTAAAKIHPHDATRTLRALEVFYATGMPLSAQQGEAPPPYPILQIGLDCGDRLSLRIQQRTQAMLAQGWIEEVQQLGDRYGWDLPLLDTLGYGEIKQFLAGQFSLVETEALIATHTRQFAKRQRTWFRSIPTLEWWDSEDINLVASVEKRIFNFLQTCTETSPLR
jgi:tRNA dimethylallyltransferase